MKTARTIKRDDSEAGATINQTVSHMPGIEEAATIYFKHSEIISQQYKKLIKNVIYISTINLFLNILFLQLSN